MNAVLLWMQGREFIELGIALSAVDTWLAERRRENELPLALQVDIATELLVIGPHF
jgi:hypothetical protein